MLLDIIVCMKYTRVVTTGRWRLEKVLMFQIEVAVQPLEIYISKCEGKNKDFKKGSWKLNFIWMEPSTKTFSGNHKCLSLYLPPKSLPHVVLPVRKMSLDANVVGIFFIYDVGIWPNLCYLSKHNLSNIVLGIKNQV